MKKEISELTKIAKQLSNRPDLIQGTGGNLSAKLDDRKMLIKASGLSFNELSELHGFITVDYAKLKARYSQKQAFNEEEESRFLLSCSAGGRPSMEAGFHAFLGRYVLHSHSVYANVLTCSVQGKQIALDICRSLEIDAAYLDYFNPGPDLAVAVYQLIRERDVAPSVIFLGNHGLIVSGDSADGVLALHQRVNDQIKQTLNLDEYPTHGVETNKSGSKSNPLQETDSAKPEDVILFPDQAVFCANLQGQVNTSQRNEPKATAIEEIITAQNYILSSIIRLRLSPRVLSQQTIKYLTNMKAEQHRRSLIR
ncbi:class II aldolase/adducin family protein [Patescibacteria group bacterium]|nr:class II aldolase/adducin family protein [Patescibacteria group bacterium]